MSSRVLSMMVLVLASLATVSAETKPVPGRDTAKRAATREGWPDTPAGEMARKWVTAFSSGEEAMRAFLSKELAPGSLERKSLDQRIASYRGLHERLGKLVLASVVRSAPSELTVKLMTSDASLQEFVFKVQPEAPYKLASVSTYESRPGGHGFGGGGGHP